MAQKQYIKHLYENEEKSLREIAKITDLSFQTVQKYAYMDNWNEDHILNVSLLPNIKLFSNITNENIFIQGLLLTASNPLTIIFWGSVFSTQVLENNYSKIQLIFFVLVCVLSTLFFLSFVSLLGSILTGFLPQIIIQILNILVGAFLIFFGIKMLLRKE